MPTVPSDHEGGLVSEYAALVIQNVNDAQHAQDMGWERVVWGFGIKVRIRVPADSLHGNALPMQISEYVQVTTVSSVVNRAHAEFPIRLVDIRTLQQTNHF